jgi:hypothetical protein
MLNVTRLREFLVEVKATIPGINYTQIVIDDSELVKHIEARKTSENTFLFAVMPQFGINGTEDQIKWNNQLMFLFLDKSTDKNFTNHDAYIDMFGNTQAVAKAFVNYILEQKSGDNGELCGLVNELKENSIVVYPVWRKAGCNGWQVEIDLLSNV